MSVLEGVEQDLARLPIDLQQSGLAAIARAMATRIDEGRGSPSECGKVAIDALVKLQDRAPAPEKKGALHDIKSERGLRLVEGQSAAQD